MSLLTKISSQTVHVTAFNVVFNIFKESSVRALNNIFIVLLAEARWAIWYCRNWHKFKERMVDSDFIISTFKNSLKIRIQADFNRLSSTNFFNLWGHNPILCKVIDVNLELLL